MVNKRKCLKYNYIKEKRILVSIILVKLGEILKMYLWSKRFVEYCRRGGLYYRLNLFGEKNFILE